MLEKLNEISKVAAVKASASLSKMIASPVGVDIAPAIEISADRFPILMKPEEQVVSMTIPIIGDLEGVAFMFFNRSFALTLCDLIFHKEVGNTQKFTELESSALIELGNIVIGNFLGPFAHPLQLNSVMHRTPIFKVDSYTTVINDISETMKDSIKESALIEISVNIKHINVKGLMLVVFGMEQIKQAVVDSTKVKRA